MPKLRTLRMEMLESRAVLATFYVATNGNDNNNGAGTTPWATLQHAVDNINAGDTIVVRAGTYAGFRIEESGTATGYKTIKSAVNAKVVINAPGSENRHNSNIEVENFDETVGYWRIRGLEVTNAPLAGIDLRDADFIQVMDCYVHDNTRWGIFTGFADNIVITRNTVTGSKVEHGIYMSNSGDNASITDNIVANNYECGIQFNADISQGGDGIMSNNLIARNIVYGNGAGGGSALNFDGLVNSRVVANLLYNNKAGGIVLYRGDAAVGSSGNLVVNNTIDMPATARWAVNINTNSINNQLYNNIIIQNHPTRGVISIDASSRTGFKSDYNLFIGPRFSLDGQNTTTTLAQWRTSTGQDSHSFTAASADALFANYTARDYRLKAGSPAIDKGRNIQPVGTDIRGKPRKIGVNVDIGAYEYDPVAN
jgi:parallel beta-helix repeat protein